MGMATPTLRTTPKPRYEGTVVCPHCYAEFMPSDHWHWGHYEGTTTQFLVTSRIKREDCPICWRKWQTLK
jgi:hypothetical protein